MSDKNVFILISKDAMCTDYLHFYGERKGQFKTPNLDELVAKGTLFFNHYTAAVSTVMSFYSMVMGKFAHETDFQMYERCHLKVHGETLFKKLKKIGFNKCHCIWDEHWNLLFDYYDYFDDVEVHNIPLKESVGVHKVRTGELFSNDQKAKETLDNAERLIREIIKNDENVFVWLHLPHVLSGRSSYGSDIDLFDQYVGMIRKYFPDDCIAVTADHGNLNGFKGKLAYGFDVYEKSARIPLITPRIEELSICEENTSSVDLFSILFQKKIVHRDFIYCDSAYRAQKHRKLAIIYKHYKYIFNKKDSTEELYDLLYNPEESMSIMKDKLFDVDRKISIMIREEYFYPLWNTLPEIRQLMLAEKKRVWRNGDLRVVVKSNLKDLIRPLYDYFLHITKKV